MKPDDYALPVTCRVKSIPMSEICELDKVENPEISRYKYT